jgi:hypothetical protein
MDDIRPNCTPTTCKTFAQRSSEWVPKFGPDSGKARVDGFGYRCGMGCFACMQIRSAA